MKPKFQVGDVVDLRAPIRRIDGMQILTVDHFENVLVTGEYGHQFYHSGFAYKTDADHRWMLEPDLFPHNPPSDQSFNELMQDLKTVKKKEILQ